MSYILEALKKLEQKRRREEGGPVAITFQEPAYKGPGKRRIWVYVISAFLLVDAGLMAWWIGPWRQTPPAVRAEPPANTQPAASPAKVSRGQADTPPATALEPKAVKPPPPPVKEMKEAPPPVKPAAPSGQAARTQPAPEPVRQPAPGETFSTAFPRAEPKPPAGGRILKHTDLPASVASALPELKMSLHYYIADPRSRFARINDRTLHEGQSLADGLKVDEITPYGAVMNFKGWRFLLPINAP